MNAVTHTLEDGIFTVTFANPPEGFFTGAMAEELLVLLPAMAADDVRVGRSARAACRAPSSGTIRSPELAALSDALRAKGRTFDETTPVDHHTMNRIAEGLEALPKPVVAALNGTAMGGGWELAMACDLRIAEAGDHGYGLPEARLGILPGAGGTQRLARLVGTARALEMTLRGRTVGPEEALALGMVHEVVPDAAARAAEGRPRTGGPPGEGAGPHQAPGARRPAARRPGDAAAGEPPVPRPRRLRRGQRPDAPDGGRRAGYPGGGIEWCPEGKSGSPARLPEMLDEFTDAQPDITGNAAKEDR